jgi:lysophospholipase L1-like esterase
MTSSTKPGSVPPTGLMDEDGRTPVGGPTQEEPPPTAEVDFKMLGNVGPAMVVLVLCVIAAYAVPTLHETRPWQPGDPLPFWNLIGRPFDEDVSEQAQEKLAKVDELAREALAEEDPGPVVEPEREVIEVDPGDQLPAYEPHPDDGKAVEQSIQFFTGHELDSFFESLARSDEAIAGSVTRVMQWGDSAIGTDGIPGAIRRRMQARFGDSGHGFHLIAPPNKSYRHKEVEFKHNEGWGHCFIIYKCRKDGFYGLGGTTFRSAAGGESWFAPSEKHSSNRVAKFDLYYAAQPRGGKLRLRVDKEPAVVIETGAEQLETRFHSLDVPDGHHELSVRAIGGGRVRLFGVTMERTTPGIVWDGLALIGAFTNRLGELNEEHLRATLERRDADLAVFMFGGNDMTRTTMKMENYEAEYRAVVQLVKRADPDLACLIMSPLDHAQRDGSRITSLPIVPKLVEAQRAVAEAEGCAFYDTYAAMGGEGSAGRWFRQKPRLIGGDFSHATTKGHVVIGEMFYRAMLEAYVAYRKQNG